MTADIPAVVLMRGDETMGGGDRVETPYDSVRGRRRRGDVRDDRRVRVAVPEIHPLIVRARIAFLRRRGHVRP